MPEPTSALRVALTEQIAEHTPDAVAPFEGVRRRARTRRRNRLAVGVFILVLVIAGGGVTVQRILAGRPRPAPVTALPTDGPPPPRLTVNGHEYRLVREGEVTNAWIDPGDRSVLWVAAGEKLTGPAMNSDNAAYCVPHTIVRVLAQDGQSVEIRAYDYEPVEPAPSNLLCGQPGLPPQEHRLALGAPLDGRRVLDGSAEVVVQDPAKLLFPGYVPAQYGQPSSVVYGGPTRGQRVVGGGVQFGYSTTSEYLYIREVDPAAEAQYNTMAGQASLFGPEEPFTIEGRPTIRGQAGLLFTYGPGLRCVRWRESPSLAVAICGGGNSGAQAIEADELLAIAEGLHRPG